MSGHCHKYVAKVAQEAANELYDTLMQDNHLYDCWKRNFPGASAKVLRAKFVAKNWGKCIPLARATMARMLAQPIDEALKETIHEALVLDATLMRGRAAGARVIGTAAQGTK